MQDRNNRRTWES